MSMEEAASRARLLQRPRNLDYLLTRRTAFVRRFVQPGQRVLEVGAGLGILPLYVPGAQVISTDVAWAPWRDAVADVMRLPFRAGAFDAVVCLNVLHHVAYPRRGLEEIVRVLRWEGALIIAEPHASVALRAALAVTRHEVVDWRVDPFNGAPCQPAEAPAKGNNAIGDLLFGDLGRFGRAFPELRLEHHRFVECATFLNSGGVGRRMPHVPLPRPALSVMGRLDDWLAGFPRWFPMCREVVLRKVR